MAVKHFENRPILLYGLLIVLLLSSLGCPDRNHDAYKKGYDRGFADGQSQASARYEQFGVTRGFIVGVLIGSAITVVFTRKYIAAEYRKFRWKTISGATRASSSNCSAAECTSTSRAWGGASWIWRR